MASSIVNADETVKGVVIPEDFLQGVYLGMCKEGSHDEKFLCSSPEAQYTDLNIWDTFMEDYDMENWTMCK